MKKIIASFLAAVLSLAMLTAPLAQSAYAEPGAPEETSVEAAEDATTKAAAEEKAERQTQPGAVESEDKQTETKAAQDKPMSSAEEADKSVEFHLVSYMDENGAVVFTRLVKEGKPVDLSLRIERLENQTGWALTKDGSALPSFTMPSKDVTLYPVYYEEGAITYTVRYMKETLTGGGYDTVETAKIPAKIGEKVSADSVQSSENGKKYTGFTYVPSGEESSVAEDGSTVVDVRFSRNTYTLKFDLTGNKADDPALKYATLKMSIGGNTYTEGDTYSFSAKYGEDISSRFPTKSNIQDNPWLATVYSEHFNGWTTPGGSVVKSANTLDGSIVSGDAADGATLSLSADWKDPKTAGSNLVEIKYHIYLESVDKAGEYVLHETLTKKVAADTATKVVIDPYEGFTYNEEKLKQYNPKIYQPNWWDPQLRYYEDNDLYFDRNAYPFNYISDGSTVKTASVRYQEPLAGYAAYEPEKPAANAVFKGWYTKEKGGKLFDFSGNMGAKETKVYARWSYRPYEIKYDLNGGNGFCPPVKGAAGAMIRVAGQESVSRKGFTLVGWNTASDGSGQQIKPNEFYTIESDATLYAMWRENRYTITYDPNGGIWSDGSKGIKTQSMPVSEAAIILEAPVREGYTFVEWRGSSYQPGDTYEGMEDGLYIDDTLTAVWKKTGTENPGGDDNNGDNHTGDKSGGGHHRTSAADNSGAPGTGDNSEAAVFGLAGILAAAGLCVVRRRREKRQ